LIEAQFIRAISRSFCDTSIPTTEYPLCKIFAEVTPAPQPRSNIFAPFGNERESKY